MRLKIILAAVLAAGLLAAGCGGDDETTASSTATTEAAGGAGEATGLLPADFAVNANAVCEAAGKDLDQAFGSLGENPSKADVDRVVGDTIVPNIQGQIDGIRFLGQPDEGAEELSAFLDDAQSTLDEVKANPGSLLKGDPFADVNDQADELGLTACAG